VLDAFDVSFFSSGKRMRIACCHSNPSSSLLWRWSRIIFRRFGDIGQICYIFVTIFVKFLYMLYFCFFFTGPTQTWVLPALINYACMLSRLKDKFGDISFVNIINFDMYRSRGLLLH
jgi:hypothetical protein